MHCRSATPPALTRATTARHEPFEAQAIAKSITGSYRFWSNGARPLHTYLDGWFVSAQQWSRNMMRSASAVLDEQIMLETAHHTVEANENYKVCSTVQRSRGTPRSTLS